MTNNDIFKKLRVALMLRDDQIVEILELVDFRISKSELSAFFRAENHENYVECGDQVLRNFLNGLVIHLRGTKENPKNPTEVLAKHKAEIPKKQGDLKCLNAQNAIKDLEKLKLQNQMAKEFLTGLSCTALRKFHRT
jgi:tRNA U55 pseudouridine synthase TruB